MEVKQSSSLYLASDTAQVVSNGNSQFSVRLNTPYVIPKTPGGVTITVPFAQLWNVTPNLYNGSFILQLPELIIDSRTYGPRSVECKIERGLYTYKTLEAAMLRAVTEALNGDTTQYFAIRADLATQRVLVLLSYAGSVLTLNTELANILGFGEESRLESTSEPSRSTFTASAPAKFNLVDTYHIKCDVTSYGIPINNDYQGIVAIVPINSPPGTQLTFQPPVPMKVWCPDLREGKSVSTITMSVTDQANRAVDFLSEHWRVIVQFSW